MKDLQTASAFTLEIVEEREGDLNLEGAIHSAMEKWRVRGEWFRFTQESHQAFLAVDACCMMPAMANHSDIVRRAGKTADVADRRGVSVYAVRSWIARNSIPAEHWLGFVNDGSTTLEELAQGATKSAA